VLVPFGTRPEIVKLAPVVRALRAAEVDVTVVATGQHYDAELTDVFYDELGVRPDRVGRLQGTGAERLGTMLTDALELVASLCPDLVLLLGDTHTVPCFCLAARNRGVPVAHLEAGLRSFNETSMEEVNRRVAAATASLHLAPTELAARFLRAEGVPAEPLLAAFRACSPARLLPFPGVREALAALRPSAFLGLVTDGEVAGQRAKVRALAMEDAFDVIVYSDDLGRAFRKPHPAPFQAALARLGVPADAAVMVGDRPDKDIAGAAAAGLRAIRVRTGEYAQRPDEPVPWRSAPDVVAAIALPQPGLRSRPHWTARSKPRLIQGPASP
jgi:HAD superfamily hydrolase (TIGR01509 family)